MMDTDPPLLKDSRLRWIAAAVLVLVVLVWLGTPNLLRSRSAANESKHALASFVAQAVESDHKILETGFMLMTVRNPSETSDKIRHIAEQMGGSVLNADISETGRDSMALLTISIPESEFEEARVQIRRVGLKVDSERLETKNATKEYVDESARLRNLHAQEMQYLTILKQAKTIKDTLEVSDKLNAVRFCRDSGA